MCVQFWNTVRRSGRHTSWRTSNWLNQCSVGSPMPGLHKMSYTERLVATGLERLDVRRLRIDLIMTYKILFGRSCLQSTDFFKFSPLEKTRGHSYKLYMPIVKSDTRKYFFSNRVLRAWNDLPLSTEDFKSLNSFRASLFKINLTDFYISHADF